MNNVAADSTNAISGTALFRSNVWSDPLLNTMSTLCLATRTRMQREHENWSYQGHMR